MELSKQMRRWGWRFFALMWAPFIILMVAMMGLPEGSYDWSELPVLARISLVAVGVFGAGSTLLLVGAPIVSGLANHAILSRGQPAEARILEIVDTGTTINQNPVVRFRLEVQPPGRPPFEAEAERLISRLQIPLVQPGSIVHVKYDPASYAVALADEDAPAAPANA